MVKYGDEMSTLYLSDATFYGKVAEEENSEMMKEIKAQK